MTSIEYLTLIIISTVIGDGFYHIKFDCSDGSISCHRSLCISPKNWSLCNPPTFQGLIEKGWGHEAICKAICK